MKSVLISALIATRVMVSANASAASPKELATTHGCMACHAVDKKLVGPAYQDVAKKYKAADKAKLVDKVMKGGSGVWGQIPMPPNAKPKADIEAIVGWVLSGAK